MGSLGTRLAPRKQWENGASPSLRSSDFSSGTLSCSPLAASKLAHKTNTGSDSRCCLSSASQRVPTTRSQSSAPGTARPLGERGSYWLRGGEAEGRRRRGRRGEGEEGGGGVVRLWLVGTGVLRRRPETEEPLFGKVAAGRCLSKEL